MVNINVKLTGINEAYTYHRKMVDRLIDGQIKLNKRAANYIVLSAKKNAPRWSDMLWESIKITDMKKNTFTISATAPYAREVELGFKPHFVDIKNPTRSGHTVADWINTKGSTRGIYYSGGEAYLHVTHAGKAPAKEGSRFMEKALFMWARTGDKIIDTEINKIFKK